MTNIEADLYTVAAEIDGHVGRGGWDRPPLLYALVATEQILADDPDTATALGLGDGGAFTPVEQEDLPPGDVAEMLEQIAWPTTVAGCALCQEIVFVPPDSEDEVGDDSVAAAAHPARREARLTVAVLRDGTTAGVLRIRGEQDELLTGPDLAPNLSAALLATLN